MARFRQQVETLSRGGVIISRRPLASAPPPAQGSFRNTGQGERVDLVRIRAVARGRFTSPRSASGRPDRGHTPPVQRHGLASRRAGTKIGGVRTAAYLLVVAWWLSVPGLSVGSTSARAGPPAGANFSYQIGGPFRPAAGVTVVDRDWHVAPAPGLYGICYLNAYQAQTGERAWWRKRHPSLLLRYKGRPVVDRAWNEQLFDTSTPLKRRNLAAVIGRWIDHCAQVGYRAVEPDNLDSWTRSHGTLTAADNLALARLLIRHAHADRLAIAEKNAAELAGRGRRLGFDFAIAEECQAYDECGNYLRAYGDAVIEIEYTEGGVRNFQRACARRGTRISIVYRDRNVSPAGQPGFVERRCRG